MKKNKIILRSVAVLLFIGLILMLIIPYKNYSKNTNNQQTDTLSKIKIPKKEVVLDFPDPEGGCMTCHAGIEPIREHNSEMMQQIYAKGKAMGDPNGCIVCHNGNVEATINKDIAHKDYIKKPGSVWVYDQTCGLCHQDHTYAMHRSLMQTEAGKIQGALWGWGAITGYEVIYGNYDIDDPDGKTPIFGTKKYKEYMHRLMEKYPNNFPDSLIQLPDPDVENIEQHPEQAVFTYLRTECLRCHVGVQGVQRRGDFRGTGCAACHIPYSDNGFYEGDDESISKTENGHLLVHSIQSSRKTKVTVNDKTYSGIPSETCVTCHNRGKRVGVSYLGMIESAYTTPWNDDGTDQYKVHGKRYNYIQDDAHHNTESRDGNPVGGLMCQDCHTTTSVHGNGNIGGTTLGEIETECADCHGTPKKYPWELPLGYGEEFGLEISDEARGITKELLPVQTRFSTIYPVKDGYLLTARGNPYGNVVRTGNKVVVHSASGLDFNVPVLKNMEKENSWENPDKAITAMVNVESHLDKMECYSCHSTWAAQCYGCHVKIDYSEGKQSTDWLKTGNAHFSNGETCETAQNEQLRTSKGKVTESRSFVRWEDPILGINGEGRVTPIIPGCQQITTVIDEGGKTLFSNKIWRTPADMENGGETGQRGIDMSPAQPHTISKKARDCASCHTNPKTLGYGINDGVYMNGYEEDRYVDLRNAKGELLSEKATPQFSAIEDLPFDLTQVVTRDGKQLQTVGHHWELSSPLTQDQRERMERVGVCISCHQDIPNGNLSMQAITKLGDMLGKTPHTDEEHSKLLNSDINWTATTRLLFPVFIIIVIIGFGIKFWWKRWKKR